jgi:hypothetical protein
MWDANPTTPEVSLVEGPSIGVLHFVSSILYFAYPMVSLWVRSPGLGIRPLVPIRYRVSGLRCQVPGT